MYDLISIGNVIIDLYFKGSELTIKEDRFNLAIGGKYLADTFYEGVGGSGANVAIGLSNSGLNTAVVAKVGENVFKQIILQKLIKKSVSTEFLIYTHDFFNISAILISQKGEKTVIHHATPHIHFDMPEVIKKKLLNSVSVYMGNLPDIPLQEKVGLLSLFAAENKRTYLNLGASDIALGLAKLAPLMNLSNTLIMNSHEYSDLVGKKKDRIDFSKNCLKSVGSSEKTLLITDGENGSYVYRSDKVYFQPAIKSQNIVDTTGAGDAYTAGFIAALENNEPIEQAMQAGALKARKIIEKIGSN